MASFAEPHQHPCVHSTSFRVKILAHNAEKRKTCLEGGWEMGFFQILVLVQSSIIDDKRKPTAAIKRTETTVQ